jgi:putative transcriptional regulator
MKMIMDGRVDPMMTDQAHNQPHTLDALLDPRMSDPAISLLAKTTAAMRADADYYKRDDDVASGLFMAAEAPAGLADDALSRVLARIEADAALDRQADTQLGDAKLADELKALPSPLREAALEALKTRGWTFGGFGIRRLALMNGDGTEAELMRVEPGYGAAPHDHHAEELTLIVTGAYDDGHGRYQAGDLSVAKPGFTHAPKAEMGEVCYLLAVTYGPPKFHGAFGVLQTALGFPWTPKTAN